MTSHLSQFGEPVAGGHRQWLDSTMQSLPAPVAYLDREVRVRFCNRAFAAWLEALPDDITDHTLPEALGHAASTRLASGIARALTGEQVDVVEELPLARGRQIAELTFIPDIDPAGDVRGLTLIARDISDRVRAERDLRMLASTGSELVATLDYEDTLQHVVRLPLPDLADFAVLYLLEGDKLQVVALGHADPRNEGNLRHFAERFHPPLDNPASPASRVTRTGVSVVADVSPRAMATIVADREAWTAVTALDGHWALVVPVAGRQRVLGALSLISTDPDRTFDLDERALAEEIGRRAGLAVENARLYREVERTREQQQFLLEASTMLASTLDYRAELEQVARLIVPAIADWCAIDLIEEDGLIHRLACFHNDPAKDEAVAELKRRFPVIHPDSGHTITKVLASDKLWFDPDIDEERFVTEARDLDHLALLRTLGFAAEIVVPLQARGRSLGTLTLVRSSRDRPYEDSDVALVNDLARRCGLAIDNARLYEAERQALAAARVSEARYRGLFEGMLDAAIVIDATGRYIDVNPAISAMLGFSREELLEREVGDLAVHRNLALAEWKRFQQEGFWRQELAIERKDGVIIDVEMAAGRIELPGAPLQVCIMRAITNRKAAQAALLESEQRLVSLVEQLPIGVGLMDARGRWLLTNSPMRRYVGDVNTSPDSAGMLRWRARTEAGAELDPADWPGARALRGETVEGVDFLVSTGAGEEMWLRLGAAPFLDAQGAVTGAIAVILNINAQKQAERAIRESEERFRLMADGSPFMIWTNDPQGNVGFVNRAYLEFFDVTLDDLHEKGWQPLLHPDDAASYVASYLAANAARQPWVGRTRIRRADGAWRWIESRSAPRYGPAGEYLGSVGSSPDITEWVQAENQRQALLDILAHDLKNPLTAIKAQANVLRLHLERRGSIDASTLIERFAGLEALAVHTAMLVDEMSDLTRLAADQPIDLKPESTDLVALVRDAVTQTQQIAASVDVQFDATADRLDGEWDPSRLRRVVLNLLSNAIKFSHEHGKVRATVSRRRRGAEIQIEDDGIGIAKPDLPHVFEFKYRGRNVGTIAGSGFGLAGARRIVEQHGGTIAVRSKEGKGSTFTVWLPVRNTAGNRTSHGP
jgi:PAS domain S-box-containing protein